MKYSLKRVGTIILADVVHIDRGKMHILGAGWSECSPGMREVRVFFNVQSPVTDAGETLTIALELWRRSDFMADTGEPVATAEAGGSIAAPSPDVRSVGLFGSMDITADLDPEEDYQVAMLLNGDPASVVRFRTRPSIPDEPTESPDEEE